MTFALIALAAVLAVLATLDRRGHAAERERLLDAQQAERDAWTAERAQLLTRIQRPDLVPIPRARPAARDHDGEPARPDQSHLVGQVALAAVADSEE